MLIYLLPLPTFLQTFFFVSLPLNRGTINLEFWRPKKRTKLPKLGSGGGLGNSGNARKKTFFFHWGLPLCGLIEHLQYSWETAGFWQQCVLLRWQIKPLIKCKKEVLSFYCAVNPIIMTSSNLHSCTLFRFHVKGRAFVFFRLAWVQWCQNSSFVTN